MTTYEIFEKSIPVSNSLKEYVYIQKQFSDESKEIISVIEENARFYEPSIGLIYRIIEHSEFLVDGLIKCMGPNYNIYDCTREDLLGGSNYLEIRKIETEFDNYCNQIKAMNASKANLLLSQAKQEASSMIKGLNFGVISSSLTAHLLYIAQNESAIKKQTLEAQAYYRQQERLIHAQGEREVDAECHQFYDEIFIPKLKNATHHFYASIMVNYLRILDKFGAVKLFEIQNFDYERSQQILNNISRSHNQKQVIATAIEICPYNVNVYVEANKIGLLNEDLLSLASDIGIDDELNAVITPQMINEDTVIDKELERFLDNEIDTFDDNWKMRANTYLAESKILLQKYPDNYATNGLVACYTIVTNWGTKNTAFWPIVNEHIEKFVQNYQGKDDILSKFHMLNWHLSDYISRYFSNIDDVFEGRSFENDIDYWKYIGEKKRLTIPAILTLQFYVQCLEKRYGQDASIVKREKNNLLGYAYDLCSSNKGERRKYKNGVVISVETTYYDIPLSERLPILEIYDKLMSEEIDKYEYGIFSRHKERSSNPDTFGTNVSREDISDTGKYYLTHSPTTSSNGCYIATCVYGSYDCPQVWQLRRFRDNSLATTWYGRTFIHCYYAISPNLVKWFGHNRWFKSIWKQVLDRMIIALSDRGFENTPYTDKN